MSVPSQIDLSDILVRAWQGTLGLNELLNAAEQLSAERSATLAAVLYQTWLSRNQPPQGHFVWFNLGATLFGLGDLPGAQDAYKQALKLAPDFPQPRFNLGLVMERMGNDDQAVDLWEHLLDGSALSDPMHQGILISTLNNLARIHENHKKYDKATNLLERSLRVEPNQPNVLHHLIYLRERQCAWPVYSPIGDVSPELMEASTSALALLSLSDDPAEQLAAAQRYVQQNVHTALTALAAPRGYRHDRIRIAYCSSDFCLHPVAMLTAELFELHDREKFEVYGFCWSPDDGSELRKRIIAAMDHFIRIDTLDDASAASLIRAHEIDVLVDLHGQTRGARANLLAHRPAPIQITYLGLPATTALPCIDYVIADRYLIPDEVVKHYSETPLYMPDVYQASDRSRKCKRAPSRKSCGLPADAFVFCCFNNNYKFTPEIFNAWIKILHSVPGSVLWLLSDNPWAETNLRREAEARGVSPHRLVFAKRTTPERYLARYKLADLFLDTFPFNGGTTANDVLWMGLPLLTLSGRSFASRMAGALLSAAGLTELIANTIDEYQEKATCIATSPDQYRNLRARVKKVRMQSALFDTPRFVRALEKNLEALVDDHSAAVKPAAKMQSTPATKTFLHVGCGPQRKSATTVGFNTESWTELRLDINEAVAPDIIGTMTDMSRVGDGAVDAVFSSHNIEHLYPHEVPTALAEFMRVLTPTGFIVITCPDLQAISGLVAEDKLTDAAYQSAAGPIAPIDVLYGHRASMASGNLYMAHRCGFTAKVMKATLATAGFRSILVLARPESFDLWAVASKSELTDEEIRSLAALHFRRPT